MAKPTILSGDADKLNLESTNYRLNSDIFNFKIQDMVQSSHRLLFRAPSRTSWRHLQTLEANYPVNLGNFSTIEY